jgi:hypothetical protein
MAATEGAVEARDRGGNGQVSLDETLVSPPAAPLLISQWCLPLCLQQAGNCDSSILPVNPDRNADVSPNALAGTAAIAGPIPRTSTSKMESNRRIRLYATTTVLLRSQSQVSSEKRSLFSFVQF